MEHEDRSETMTGPSKCDLVTAWKGHRFFHVPWPKTHEIITAQSLRWTFLRKLLGQLFKGLVLDTLLRPDDEWKNGGQTKAATLD